MPSPTPSICPMPLRKADFATLTEALDYASGSERGLNFYSGNGQLLESLRYRDLRDQARSLARRLLAAGFVPGEERIALVAETGGDFVRFFFACLYAGIAPLPLPLPMAFGGRQGYVGHIRRMLGAARVSGLFAPAFLADWALEAAEGLPLRVAGGFGALDGHMETADALPAIGQDDVAYLQFSSGSTRFPSGITVTHRALMENARAIVRHGLQIVEGDRGVSWLPFYHDMGLVGFLLAPLAAQISVDYLPTGEFARRPLTWLSLIARNRGTLSYSPSFGYELCAKRAAATVPEGLDLSSWRAAGIGGDMIRPQVLAGFARSFAPCGFDPRAFVPSYGMAETTLAVSFAPLRTGVEVDRVDLDVLEGDGLAAAPRAAGGRTRDFVLCGPPLAGHEVEVRDPGGAPLGERRLGRLFVRGPSLMHGYFDQPEETARVLSADGWLDTGDLGYRVGGALVITGRAKDLILINGRNIWPQDLEWSVERAGGLRSGDVAAFAIEQDEAERIVLLVHCRTSDPDARRALKSTVAGTLRAEHGAEAQVLLVPSHSLPQTSSGKLSRSRARQLFLAGAFGDGL
ncbi:fatty acyl-AMP ligase [Azospirillum sp. YIM B02556]|uniref:Fatty acyl-AMP ligase n=1 Tax=Azospirillum endophyticum TaxID=2800326 RepID=A0ABS1FGZ3_9PROT|nr:fatty acyl-AMP ligase [Azospirillum endophyticum]MBK1842667.1 fatty acyl-AMP ligase [Azospirillum endophyticum]